MSDYIPPHKQRGDGGKAGPVTENKDAPEQTERTDGRVLRKVRVIKLFSVRLLKFLGRRLS